MNNVRKDTMKLLFLRGIACLIELPLRGKSDPFTEIREQSVARNQCVFTGWKAKFIMVIICDFQSLVSHRLCKRCLMQTCEHTGKLNVHFTHQKISLSVIFDVGQQHESVRHCQEDKEEKTDSHVWSFECTVYTCYTLLFITYETMNGTKLTSDTSNSLVSYQIIVL